jgi:hypothetical protein
MRPKAIAEESSIARIVPAQAGDAAGFICTSAVFALVFWRRIAINSASDLHAHIDYAKHISNIHDIVSLWSKKEMIKSKSYARACSTS